MQIWSIVSFKAAAREALILKTNQNFECTFYLTGTDGPNEAYLFCQLFHIYMGLFTRISHLISVLARISG